LKPATRAAAAADPLFASYVQLATSLVGDISGLLLLDADLKPRGCSKSLRPAAIAAWLRGLGWEGGHERSCTGIAPTRDEWLTAIPMEQSDGTLLGAFCLQQSVKPPPHAARHATDLAGRLKPLLDCVHRELSAAVPVRSRVQSLTERTAELEWLFKVTGKLKGAADDRRIAEELLIAATEHLDCGLGVLAIPDKRLLVTHERDAAAAPSLREVWTRTQPNFIGWAQRHNRPLVMNGVGRDGQKIARCKILSVPVVRDTGRVLGVLAFLNPPSAADFVSRHVFMARHLGRETAAILDAQFDLVTGLYTRDGLEKMYGGFASDPSAPNRSLIYIDVDHMHVVNELHGFDLGNELIVRIADILSSPLLPKDALAARIAGDRFAVILAEPDPAAAAETAAQIQAAARQVALGPADNALDVSVSCGVAILVAMPQGLARAMAAAELACKTAKNRGGNRVELYACEDGSMMRQHSDAMAVGQLRSAMRHDRLLLYAQRIAPLQNGALPGGYELLLRMQDDDGAIVAPGPLLQAAKRYQLLPSVDRWVIQRALETLGSYRGVLRSRGVSISINMSGQSVGDETCIRHFTEQMAAANLPRDCIVVEITEQAAVTNLARANEMIHRLGALGCRFALDDFGTGANSLVYLKNLQLSRLKIDGSFVRDILADKNSVATVRAIVELARSLSMDTVAEYVETEEIGDAVRRLGVDYAQGYAYGRPEPLEDVLRSLSEDESRRLRRLFLES